MLENAMDAAEAVVADTPAARPTTLLDKPIEEEIRPGGNPKRRGLQKLATHVAVMLVSVLLSALAVELFIRMFVAVQNVGPSFAAYDPTLLMTLKKNVTCVRINPEFRMHMTTDSHGFRGPELPSVPGDCVLFLGDSQTMGYGVSDGEQYPSLIGKTLDARYGPGRFTIINTAMAGMGNGRWLKVLRGGLWGFQPKLVIVQFSNTDFGDNVREALFKLSPSGELVELPMKPEPMILKLDRLVDAIPGLSNSYSMGLCKQVIAQLMSQRTRTTASAVPFYPPGSHQLTYKLVEESIAICRRQGWPVLLLATDQDQENLAEIERFCGRLKVPLVPVPTRFMRPDLFFAIDAHLNVAGQRYVADLIEARLAADGILLRSAEQKSEGGRPATTASNSRGDAQ